MPDDSGTHAFTGLAVYFRNRQQLFCWIAVAAVAVVAAAGCSILLSPRSLAIRDLEHRGATVQTEFIGPEWLEDIKGDRRFLPWERVTIIGMEVDETDRQQLDDALVFFPELDFLIVTGKDQRPQDLTHLSSCRNVRLLGLYHLSLSQNQIDRLADLRSLENLYLDESTIEDHNVHVIGRLSRLQELSLADTQVTDQGVAELSGLHNLLSLDLSGTAVTDEGLRELIGLKRLGILRLSRTRVGEASIVSLRQMKTLRYLHVDQTPLEKIGSEALHAALPDLRINSETTP